MKFPIVKAMLLLAVAAISCNHINNGLSDESKSIGTKEMPADIVVNDVVDNPEPQQIQNPLPNQQPQQVQPNVPKIPVQPSNPNWDKKLVKTATIKLEVKDVKLFNQSLPEIVKRNGAYVSNEQNNFNDGFTESTVTIKVPVLQFENLINELNIKESKLIERSINTDDVTTEVVDTRARMEARKEMRLKYLEFLKQSKNMTEALQVQKEINNLQEEIESATARIESLSQQAAYSTVLLTYYNGGYSIYETTPNSPFFSRVLASFKNGAGYFGDIIIGLIDLWPIWIFSILIFLVVRKRKSILKFF
ncbi:MAG: DUF4349 domain-containing protein [Chitinophagaceae bacterium]|nr:DUF4349 domain-containing protein [Chitinophagaceae bacterium]